jgi:putative transcriptional regulator
VTVNYDKLWKLLIDNKMKKGDLQKAAKMSSKSMAKLGKNENVSLDILLRICKVLGCELADIMATVNE